MKSDYRIRAQKFVKSIYPFICDCRTESGYKVAVKAYNRAYHRNVRVEAGACRVVLMCADYVIKIDYSESSIESFGGCSEEMQFYRKAYEDGYDYLFAEITEIFYEGRYFYAMPFIPHVGEDKSWNWNHDEESYVFYHIGDLHEYNVGFKGGRAVVIDYASVEEWGD